MLFISQNISILSHHNVQSPESYLRCRRQRSYAAHTAVLCLPGEEVQQRPKRLTYKTEADPENTITDHLSGRSAHLLQGCSERNQRQLEHHSKECNTWEQSAKAGG